MFCVLPSPKHFPSSWRVSAKPTGAHNDVKKQQELCGRLGIWARGDNTVDPLEEWAITPSPHTQLIQRGLCPCTQKWMSWNLATSVKVVQCDYGQVAENIEALA